jgi:hypothetical protein
MRLETRTIAGIYGGSVNSISVPRFAKFLAVYKIPTDYFGVSYSVPDTCEPGAKTWLFKIITVHETQLEGNWTYVGTINCTRSMRRTVPTSINYANALPYSRYINGNDIDIRSLPVQTSKLDIPSIEVEEQEYLDNYLIFMSSSISEKLSNDIDTSKQLGLF